MSSGIKRSPRSSDSTIVPRRVTADNPEQPPWALVPCTGLSALSRQLLQQHPSLLEIGGVKALREPAIDRCQEVSGFGVLTLLLPEATEAHGGPQFQGLGLLAAGHVQGLLQPGFRLRL